LLPRPFVFRLATLALLSAPVFAASTVLANPADFLLPALPLAADARFTRNTSVPAAHSAATGAISAPRRSSSAADGKWQEFHLLQVSRQRSIYDAARDELLSIGGTRPTNSTLPLGGPPSWQPLPAMSPPTYFDATAEDPVTGLVYIAGFGGAGLEISTLDPRTGTVTPLVASGTPPLVALTSLLFDAVNQRLLVFGGLENSEGYAEPTNKVWALDLQPAPAWSEWSPAGTPPPPVYSAYTVLDPVRRYLLIPDARQPSPYNVWALTLDGPPEWRHFPTNGLPLGANPNPFIYDSVSDRVWTVDGQLAVYSLSPINWQWQKRSPAGAGPSPRQFVGLALDATRHRLLVSGGIENSGADTHADTWAFSLDDATWTQLIPDAVRPPVREAASDALDPSRHRLVVFGGSNEVGGVRNDTWALDLAAVPTWSELATLGGPPPPRYWHSSAWDPLRDEMLVYGGYGGDFSHPLGDLWALSFGGGSPTWAPIAPAGPGPSPRMAANLVYDSKRDRFLLMFGGDAVRVLAEVWELKLSPAPAWRALAPTGTPPSARAGAMAVYDPERDRVIVLGGVDYLDDLWALDLGAGGDGAWQRLLTPSRPPGRQYGLLRLDTLRDRMVLFGGYGPVKQSDNTTVITWLDDTWALDLRDPPTWRQLAPTGFTPPPRDRANGAYDPIHDRLVLACGSNGNGSNDTWALSFADTPTPTLLALASVDVTAERVRLVWAGAEPGASVTAYRRAPDGPWASLGGLFADGRGFVTLVDRDVTPGARLEYRLGVGGGPGETFFGATPVQVPMPALALSARSLDGRLAFTVQLPSGEPASLAIFDLAGRRLWSRSVGQLGVGTHDLSADGAALRPGLYFARLTQGAASCLTRAALLR